MTTARSNRVGLLIACTLPLTAVLSACSQAVPEDIDSRQKKLLLLNQLTTDSQGEERVGWNAEKGIPTFLSGTLSPQKASNARAALQVIEEKKALFDMERAADELTLKREQRDAYGRTFRFKQLYQGIPVFGRELVVNTGPQDDVRTINGDYEPSLKLRGLDTRPRLSEAEAVAAAKKALGLQAVRHFDAQRGEVNVYPARDGTYHLVYVVSLATLETGKPVSEWVMIDAHDGTLVHRITRVDTGAVVGTGTGLGNVTRAVNADSVNGVYEMRDLTRGATIETYDSSVYGPLGPPITTDADNVWTDNPDAVDVHAFTGEAYDYFYDNLGRDSFDDLGLTVKTYVNFGSSPNAYYYPVDSSIRFGSDWGRIDVTGHEFTHGVVEYTAGLLYEAQPGALNESWADAFGELIDGDGQWLMGEDLPFGAIRSMRYPENFNHPSHMNDFQYLPATGDYDWGGVHSNSGIPNRAFYLVATARGVTKAQAGEIWYRALKNYLTPTSQFSDARMATIQAAADLFGSGSAQTNAVIYAWNGVGVGNPAPNDAYEPNDSRSAAWPISSGTTYSSKISNPSDADYFLIDVASGAQVQVNLTGLPADYDLQLINPTGSVVGMSGIPGTGNETITYTASTGGAYAVKVYGYGGAFHQSGAYALTVTLTYSTPPTATDPYESNDSISTAYPMLTGFTYKGLISSASDVDYFQIDLGEGTQVQVDLTSLPADYDLQLVNPTGSVVGMSGIPGTGNETITYTATVSGTYQVKVYGYGGAYHASSNYTLRVTSIDPAPPGSSDAYEPNDLRSTALPISAGVPYSSQISSASDVDYFRIQVEAGTDLRVDLTGVSVTHLPADYDLGVVNSTGSTIAVSAASGTGNEWIEFTVGQSGTYWVKVYGHGGAYSTTANYKMWVTLTP